MIMCYYIIRFILRPGMPCDSPCVESLSRRGRIFFPVSSEKSGIVLEFLNRANYLMYTVQNFVMS